MAKERTGFVVERAGKIYARVSFTDESGKRRELMRRAENRSEAKQIIKKLLRELDDSGARAITNGRMTFDSLASYFEANFLQPAEYVGDRKIAGVRSVGPARAALAVLRAYFGKRALRSITYADVRAFRAARLKLPTNAGKQRSIATVNRELSKLRRMFNIAQREGWMQRNPFSTGESLISAADEKNRERILTRAEETRLLEACEHPRRAHLKGILLVALDCALRRGEILTLRWSEVDLGSRTITITAYNSKTARERTVAMTTRVWEELQRLWEVSPQDETALVFGITDTVKRSFASACKTANVRDFRLHDCRHTAITRMIRAGMPPTEVMRVSGHTTMTAFYRYANSDMDTARRAAAAMDAFNTLPSEASEAPEMIN